MPSELLEELHGVGPSEVQTKVTTVEGGGRERGKLIVGESREGGGNEREGRTPERGIV